MAETMMGRLRIGKKKEFSTSCSFSHDPERLKTGFV